MYGGMGKYAWVTVFTCILSLLFTQKGQFEVLRIVMTIKAHWYHHTWPYTPTLMELKVSRGTAGAPWIGGATTDTMTVTPAPPLQGVPAVPFDTFGSIKVDGNGHVMVVPVSFDGHDNFQNPTWVCTCHNQSLHMARYMLLRPVSAVRNRLSSVSQKMAIMMMAASLKINVHQENVERGN